MNGKYLLDTNIVIALFAQDDEVMNHMAAAEQVFVPCIVVGELCYGAQKSGRPEINLTRINEFVASNEIVNCDAGTGEHYGNIKNQLRLKGRPVPENDLWIAAIALQHRMVLVTRDSHFDEIASLVKTPW